MPVLARPPGTAVATVSIAIAALVLGIGMPFYLGAVQEGVWWLLAVPLLILLTVLFVINRRALLWVLLLTRASGDVFLLMLQGNTRASGPGLGAVLNAGLIVLVFSLIVEQPRAVPRPVWTVCCVLLLTAVYAIALSPIPMEGIRFYENWMTYFACLASGFYLVDSRKGFRFALGIVFWSTLGPAFYALVELALHAGQVSGGYRLAATFTHPNVLASYLIVTLPIGFYLLKTAPYRTGHVVRQLALGTYLCLLVGMLVLTQTRSAWLALFLVLLGYALLFDKRYLVWLAVIVIVSLWLPAIQERLADLASGNEGAREATLNSFAWRLALWSAAFDAMEPYRYLLGYGAGAFKAYSSSFFPLGGGLSWDAHNVYVQWFFDAGMVGVAAFVFVHLRLAARVRPLWREDRLGAFIVLAIIGCYLLISVSDNLMFYLAVNWYYFFVVGVALKCAYVTAQEAAAPAFPTSAATPYHGLSRLD